MGKIRHILVPTVILLVISIATDHVTSSKLGAYYDSGCSDGTTEALQDGRHRKIAACSGVWEGHIENATSLCSEGWRVCGWYDQTTLKSINWKDATELAGCYAINAAQDGGQCAPCTSNIDQDDLAGVGKGCPHQSYGAKSCISGGQIDVSCCSDTNFSRACTYRPGLTTGVLCCRLPGVRPQILVRPQEFTHVQTSVTFVLSCQAMGTPTPVVKWYKNDQDLPSNVSRISVFESGYLLISEAQPSDSGDYSCVVTNTAGSDKSIAKVIVTDHDSGCADGTTDGLHQYEDIQACQGRWNGHVKRAKHLCTKGWRVCNPRHTNVLKLLTWTDVTEIDGCYAYNAANMLNQCARCHRQDLAGIGKRCGRIRRTYKSCLAQGRIDVYSNRFGAGCSYQEGITSGILCCRKHKRQTSLWQKAPKCSPKCANGGNCISTDRCQCQEGYKGAWCQNPICPGGCIPNSMCVKPGVCQCKMGYTGKKCRRRKPHCRKPCLNGGRCKDGKCKCPKSHTGPYCHKALQWRPLAELNRTER